MFYGHFCVRGRLNGPSELQREGSKVKDETDMLTPRFELRW